jgi:hypothetical protein
MAADGHGIRQEQREGKSASRILKSPWPSVPKKEMRNDEEESTD